MIIHAIIGLVGLVSIASSYATLSDETLRGLPGPGDDFHIKDGALLAPILQTRVPGTPGSTAVLTHFVDFFQQSLPKWTLSFQNSSAKTPLSGESEVPFVNLIATRDPPWALDGEVGRLALVAHYDSKLDPPGFIGAIDSAAPCAMIMHAARALDDALTRKWTAMEAEGVGSGGFGGIEQDVGLQILLLDGEEAFRVWTHADSIYGARYDNPEPTIVCPIGALFTDCVLGPLQRNGNRPCIRQRLPIVPRSIPSICSCSWTSWDLLILVCRPTSRRHIGLTSAWVKLRRDCDRYSNSSRRRIILRRKVLPMNPATSHNFYPKQARATAIDGTVV